MITFSSMKNLIIFFVFISSLNINQDSFEFSKKGLTPKETTIFYSNSTSEKIFYRISSWMKSNKKKLRFEINKSEKNKSIDFTVTSVDVRYSRTKSYYPKVYLKIDINDEELVLTPYKIELKKNSKYDMGWKELNLEQPYVFFKGKKGNKKLFLNKIAQCLNELKSEIEKCIN